MEVCDCKSVRQQWIYDSDSGVFINQVKGWCLFAGRPNLVGKQLKTWGCDASNSQMTWD